MSGKFALIIGNTEYTDPGLAQLTAPGKDAEDFARVLKDTEIGAFDQVNIVLNQSSSASIEAIDEFFNQRMPDDLLVLYFSGHGVRDELGALYLAVKNTIRSRLRSTAIKSDYIREAMDQSRSRRQVLILDCCNSGAFAQGTKAATGVSIGTASAFEGGYGRVILTASDSTQFAWEGDRVIGETDNSLFTHYLVEGLEGEADQDGDGRITVDELYDYAYEKIRFATPKQTPSKFSSKQQGEIVLRQSMPIEKIKPLPLPDDLSDEIEDLRPYVREVAVQKLEKLLKGKSIGLAHSARESLERIATEDDSNRLRQLAIQTLELVKQVKVEQKADVGVERLAHPQPKHKVAEKITPETTKKAKYEPAKGHSARFYSIWWSALTKPTVANYQTIIEDPNVSQKKAHWWIYFAGAISWTIFLLALINSEVYYNIFRIREYSLFDIIILYIIAPASFLATITIYTIVTNRVANAMGGQGDYTKLVYLLATFSGLMILDGLIIGSPIWESYKGAITYISDSLSMCFGIVFYIIPFVMFTYPIFLLIVAIKAVNKFSWSKAITSSMVFPLIFIILLNYSRPLIDALDNIYIFNFYINTITGNTRP